MSEVNFKSLQTVHESLLQKQQKLTEENQGDFAREVRAYIEQAKKAGSMIPSTRERDQVRANLRYWANYIYSIEKSFPDTELAPSTVTGGQSFWTSRLGLAVLGLALVILIGIGIGSSLFGGAATVTPTSISSTPLVTAPVQGTSTTEANSTAEPNSTPVFGGVALTSPENGANVLPKVQFSGVSANLKVEDSIHLLIVRGDLFFPLKEFIPQARISAAGDWKIDAFLYRDEKDLEQPENLIVVPAVCFDQQCRDTLDASVDTGIASKNLPSQRSFRLYQDSSRVLYRNAYQAAVGTRLTYSLFKGTSYDLYTAKIGENSGRQITFTTEFSEMFPDLSADGTKIVYVKRMKDPNNEKGHLFAIWIMDSNGENDHELIGWTKKTLENPQWSPNSTYISYTIVESRGSSGTPYSSIHLIDPISGEVRDLTGEPYALVHRYSSWIPNGNSLVFDAAISDRTRLIQVSIDSQTLSPFFDPQLYVSQPKISLSEDGYLMTFITIGPEPNYYHDIYVTIDSDGELPFDGTAVRLIKSTGELLDFPRVYPEGNALYFTTHGSIYRIEYQIIDGQITLKPNTSASGEVVIKTPEVGDRVEPIYFDIGYMEAFFPIDQTSVTPPP